MERCLYSSS